MSLKEKLNELQDGVNTTHSQAPITRELLEHLNRRQCPIQTYGENFSLLLMGEEHHQSYQVGEQIGLISILSPEYVLCEGMPGFIYDGKNKKLVPQEGRVLNSFDQHPWQSLPPEFYYNAQQFGYQLVGCDLTDAESESIGQDLMRVFPNLYYYDENSRRVIRRGADPVNFELRKDDYVICRRDRYISQTIIPYAQHSSKPVVAIVGATHARNIHQKKLLQNGKIEYAVIDQAAGLGPFYS